MVPQSKKAYISFKIGEREPFTPFTQLVRYDLIWFVCQAKMFP